MRAYALHSFNAPLVREEREIPTPTGDEVLLRVTACGLCHSDLHIVDGRWPAFPLPRVLGHEIAGFNEELGNVIVYAPFGCGTCEHCSRTEEVLCADVAEAGMVRDGGYAEHVLVPHRRFLYPIGDLDPAHAAPLACGGLTPYRAVRRTLALAGSRTPTVALIGAGGLGQFGIQYLHLLSDARVVVVDPAADKRARALELGVEAAAAPDEVDGRYDAVLDFVGSDGTGDLSRTLVRQGGVVMQVGAYGGGTKVGLSLVPHESIWSLSLWGSRDELGDVIRIAARGDLQWQTETMPLDDVDEAHRRLRAGEVTGRLVLVP
jgi:propanol-preferring alcohol dehydrogenase